MLPVDAVSKIREYATKNINIAALYLFGSCAHGTSRKNSDVDIGVLYFKDVDGLDRISLETRLSNLLTKEVDLIDLKKAGPLLRHQVYLSSKEIYKRETQYPALFRANSINEYLDYLYFLEKRIEIRYG